MSEFYVFNENGVMMFTTSDEDYASAWCDLHNGYYCADEPGNEVDYCAGRDCDSCGYGLLGECHLQCTH